MKNNFWYYKDVSRKPLLLLAFTIPIEHKNTMRQY